MDKKIIRFSDLKMIANEQPIDRDAILDIVVLPEIDAIIQEAGLNPMKFRSNDTSLNAFMNLPIKHREEDDSFCTVSYDYCSEEAIYRAECVIFLEEDMVSSETDLYKLEDYTSGNREWLWFNGQGWEAGPGENYFDLKDILDGYRQ